MAIQENIQKLRQLFDITQEDLAKIAGVTRGAVSQWEGGFSEPRMGAIQKMADHFGIKKSNIIEDGGMDNFDPVTRKERPAIPGAMPIAPSPVAYLPLMGSIHAGVAEEPDVYTEEMRQVPAWVAEAHPYAFLLRVEGDCMSRVYPEGSIIAIDPKAEVTNGCVAAVQIDDTDFLLRRWYRTADTLVLSPDSHSTDHRDLVFSGSDWDEHFVKVVGRVVWYMCDGEM